MVGLDLVEVAPAHDPTGSTSTLAAQLLLNVIERFFVSPHCVSELAAASST